MQCSPRVWVPRPEERDLRQLLKHRDKLVGMRTSVKNQLYFLAMSQGVCRRKKHWSVAGRRESEALRLGEWASRRRQGLLDRLNPRIEELNEALRVEAEHRSGGARLMQQKGVASVTALAFVLMLWPVERFPNSRKVVSYLGLNPSERSSGGRQRLGHISKQGNEMLRWLLVEAAQSAAQFDPELGRKYLRLKFRRGAKVAMARHLALRLHWMLRQTKVAPSPVRTPESPARTLVDSGPSIL